MCGRMTLTNSDLAGVAALLDAKFEPADASRFGARYNVAPTDLHWVLVAGDKPGERCIVPAVWGLPSPKAGYVINVRGESVARGAFRSRQHALALADGFLEWRREGKHRQPIWYRGQGPLLLMASVVAPLGDASSKAPIGFSVITVAANDDVAPVHDRMPALISAPQIDEWLAGAGVELLRPSPTGTLSATPVSERVNRVRNDDPECLVAAQTSAGARRQLSLFGAQ